MGLGLPKALVDLALKDLVSNTTSDLGPLHASTFRDPTIVRWIHNLWRHAALGGAHCRLGTDSLLFGTLAGIARKLNAKDCQRGLDEVPAKRVRDYVEDHLSDNVSLVELATICGLSPMHFARQFKLRTGISPYQYVLQRRLDRAKMLLAATDHTLAEIAYETGFSSQAHMSTTFTSRIGQPPGRYRLSLDC